MASDNIIPDVISLFIFLILLLIFFPSSLSQQYCKPIAILIPLLITTDIKTITIYSLIRLYIGIFSITISKYCFKKFLIIKYGSITVIIVICTITIIGLLNSLCLNIIIFEYTNGVSFPIAK